METCDPATGCVAGTPPNCDDGNECTFDGCTAGQCFNVPIDGACTDDGDPCTYDLCNNGACTHPPKADCVDCGGDSVCIGGSCQPPTCSISVDGGMVCAGGAVDVDITFTCGPACGDSMNITVSQQPSDGTATVVGGAVPCDESPHTRTLHIEIDQDAPVGPQAFTLLGDNGVCQTGGSVTVIGPDLQFGSVLDEDELNPGGYICVNDDDDNDNGTPDKDEAGPISGENDLVAVTLNHVGLDPSDTVRLSFPDPTDASKVKFYDAADKTGPFTLPRDWLVSALPVTEYAEGYDHSAAERDIGIRLRNITGPPGNAVN